MSEISDAILAHLRKQPSSKGATIDAVSTDRRCVKSEVIAYFNYLASTDEIRRDGKVWKVRK